jgi:hypothetical protein
MILNYIDYQFFFRIILGDEVALSIHNWLYFPPTSDYITFKSKSNDIASILGFKFIDGDKNTIFSTQLLINNVDAFKDYFVKVPEALKGKTGTFSLELMNYFDDFKRIDIDDIDLTNNAPTPTASITALGETTFCNASQTVQLKASTTNPDYEYQWQKNGLNIASATDTIYTTNSAGDYKLKVVSKSTGLSAISDSIKISYNELTDFTVSGGGTVGIGEAIALNATGGEYYLWQGPNGFVSNVQYPVRYSATSNMSGNYTVKITAKSGCSATANVSVNVVSVSENSTNCPPLVRSLKSIDNNLGSAYHTQPFSDDKYITVLYKDNIYSLALLDSNLAVVWRKTLSSNVTELVTDNTSNIFIRIGNTISKYNSSGNLIWSTVPSIKIVQTLRTTISYPYSSSSTIGDIIINPNIVSMAQSNDGGVSFLFGSNTYKNKTEQSQYYSSQYQRTITVTNEYSYSPVNNSATETEDFFVAKIGSNGTVSWFKSYGDNCNSENPIKIKSTSNGGFVFMGKSCNNLLKTYRIDANGNTNWNSQLTLSNNSDVPITLSEASDGGALVGVSIFRNNQYDIWLGKISSGGGLSWSKTFGNETIGDEWSSKGDYIIDIKTENNNFIVTGILNSTENDVLNPLNTYHHPGWLAKISQSGTTDWSRKYTVNSGEVYFRSGELYSISGNNIHHYYDFEKANFNVSSFEKLCINQSIQLNSSVEYWHTSDYINYKWYSNGKLIPNNQTAYLGVSQNGTYHAKIEMTNGCSVVTPPVTIVTPKVSSNAIYVYNTDDNGYQSTSNGLCEGATLNLSAEGGDAYAWTGPNNFVSNEQNPSILNITTDNGGLYYCTITNTKRNCIVTLSTEVNVISEILNEFTIRSPIEEGEHTSFYYCCDYGNPLSAKIIGPNGYINNNPIGAGFDWYDVLLKQAGTYTIQKQVGNCIKTYTQNLVVNPCPLNPIISYSFQNSSANGSVSGILNSTNSNSFCIKPNTEIGLSARGSSSNSDIYGFSYQWYRFGVPIANATNSYIYINQSGTYSVKVSRYGRCEKVSPNYIINVNYEPEFTTNVPTPKPICQGQAFTFQASPQTNSYTWTGSDNFNTNGHTIVVTNIQPARTGNYTIKATNTSGCSLTKQAYFQVEENPKPQGVLGENGLIVCCNSLTYEGIPWNLYSSYYGYSKYYWEGPNGFNAVTSYPGTEYYNFHFPEANFSQSGTYKLTVESFNGCTTKVNIDVEIKKIEIKANEEFVCKNSEVQLSAKYCNGTILWSTEDSTINSGDLLVYPSRTTTYTARCISSPWGSFIGSVSDPITITVYPDPPKPIVKADNYSVCYPDVVTLRSSGCSYQTSWSPYNSTVTDSVLNLNLGEGTYKLAFSCISENGCSSELESDSITVNVYNKPSTPNIQGIPQSSYLAGQEVTLFANYYGSPSDTLIWSNGMRGISITVNPVATTTYTVYAKSPGGCISDVSQPVIITINGALPLTIQANTSEVCAGSSINLSAIGCSGSVLWSTGQTGLKISTTINTTTIYTASCLLNGSIVSISNELTINVVSRLPTPQIQASKLTIGEGESVTLTAQGCKNTIKWSNGQTGNIITVFPSNNSSYRAICTYNDFCESDSSSRLDILVTPFIDCNFFQNVRVEIRKSDYWEYENNKIPQGTAVPIIGDIINPDFDHLPIKWLVKNLANEIIDSISNTKEITVKCSQSITVFASIRSGQCENVSSLNLSIDDTDNIGCFDLNGNALDGSERNVDGHIFGNVLPTTDRFNNPNSALYFPGNMDSWVKVLPPLPVQPSFYS